MNERDLSLASHFSWESWKPQPNVLTHHQEGGYHLLTATICKGFRAKAILDSSVLIYPSFVVTEDTLGIKTGALHRLDKHSNSEIGPHPFFTFCVWDRLLQSFLSCPWTFCMSQEGLEVVIFISQPPK